MADEKKPPEGDRRRARRRTTSTSARGRKLLRLQSAKNVLEHALLTEVRELDLSGEWRHDGATSCAQWLTWYTGAKLSTAYERLRVAHALATLKLVDAALAAGEISYTQARALTRLGAVELQHDMLEIARKHSGEGLERGLRQVRDRAIVDAVPIERRALRATFEDLGDGSAIYRQPTGREATARVKKALHGIKQEDAPNGPSSMTDAEAFEALLDRATRVLPGEDPRTIRGRYELVVMVSAEALEATDGNRPPMTRCELHDGTQLSVDAARRIACDSPIRALLVARDGTPLDVGRRTRKVSERLRTALLTRDRHCTFPGCTSRLGLDAHHIEHWIDGGETKESNLTMLCRRHHVEVHDRHYQLVRTATGVEFRGPDGGAPEQDASGPRGTDRESLGGGPIVPARPASGLRRTHHTDGLILPRGPSVPRFSGVFPATFDEETFARYPGLRGALRMAVDEWTARTWRRTA